MTEEKWRKHYTYVEVHTGLGQYARVECHPDDVERVKEIFKNIRIVELPITSKVCLEHGSFGAYSRYKIEQRYYAGGHGGYIEALEIFNPPENRCGNVIYWRMDNGNRGFSEFETMEDAVQAAEKGDFFSYYEKSKGFKRKVKCGYMLPWFYAIGDEELIGDYVLPNGLQDDPVFVFGKTFLVYEYGEFFPALKTCMGTRFIEDVKENWRSGEDKKYVYRLVHFHDGSTWSEKSSAKKPVPLHSDHIWIDEAVDKFKECLSGKSKEFSIDFADGTRFIGRIKTASKAPTCAGSYYVAVHFRNIKTMRGRVEFEPTEKDPDLFTFIKNRIKDGDKIDRIEIVSNKTERGGKKWKGAINSN